jgi:hypothetical protein
VEGVIYSSPATSDEPLMKLNAVKNCLVSLDAKIEIGLFAKIKVKITVTDAGEDSAQRSKLILSLVEPKIPGMDKENGVHVTKKRKVKK